MISERARVVAATALVVAAAAMWALDRRPAPVPGPTPDGPLTLAGLFVGPKAAEDAATLASLASEIADEIEWDGGQEKPLYVSGTQLDELRSRARAFRCRGERIGDRQPKVRDAIHAYLDDAVGVSGGPVTPAQRQKWVDAYRAISEAASNATK